jgi:hypothetical protein
VQVLLAVFVEVSELHIGRFKDGFDPVDGVGVVSLAEEIEVYVCVGDHLVVWGQQAQDEAVLSNRQVG